MMTLLRQAHALQVDDLQQATPAHKREQAVCAGPLMVAACPAAGRCSTGLPAAKLSEGRQAAQGRSPHCRWRPLYRRCLPPGRTTNDALIAADRRSPTTFPVLSLAPIRRECRSTW